MSKFFGRFETKLDSKGRTALPAVLRKSEEIDLIITSSQYKSKPCLDIYSQEDWLELQAKVSQLSPIKPEVQAFQRFYMSAGQSVKTDAQGRFLIPKFHRNYAQFENDLVFVGMGKKIEVWDAKIWAQVHAELAKSFEQTLAVIGAMDMTSKEETHAK